MKLALSKPLANCLSAFAMLISLFVTTNLAHAADLKLEEFFKGTTHAFGKFSAINGTKRTFHVLLNGKWDGKTLVLREDFFYDDGEKDVKTWRFTKTSPSTYTGTREDVKGTTEVKLKGNKAKFTYIVDIDNGPEENLVRFRDTLTLEKDGTLRNTAIVTKFGLPVAYVEVNFATTKAKAKAIRPR